MYPQGPGGPWGLEGGLFRTITVGADRVDREDQLLSPVAEIPADLDSHRVVDEKSPELLDELLAPIPRIAIVPAIEEALGLPRAKADAVVQAFDDFVAKALNGHACGGAG